MYINPMWNFSLWSWCASVVENSVDYSVWDTDPRKYERSWCQICSPVHNLPFVCIENVSLYDVMSTWGRLTNCHVTLQPNIIRDACCHASLVLMKYVSVLNFWGVRILAADSVSFSLFTSLTLYLLLRKSWRHLEWFIQVTMWLTWGKLTSLVLGKCLAPFEYIDQ